MSDMEDRTKRIDEAKGPCRICGGKFSEHTMDIIHQFAEVEGDLTPRPSMARDFKRGAKKDGTRDSFNGSEPETMARLLRVLHRKGVLSDADVLEVVGFTTPPVSAPAPEGEGRSGDDS